MRSVLIWVVALANLVIGDELRTWKDSTGKFSIEAEFVSSEDGVAVLKTADGSQLKVPFEKLCEEDRKHIQSLQRQTPSKPDTASKSKSAIASPQDTKLVREIAEAFYNDLRTKERNEARGKLTEEAQTLFDEGKSSLPLLPAPDPGATALRIAKAKIVRSQALVPVQVRVGGDFQQTSLHLRKSDDLWQVFAISAKLGSSEKTVNFEAALAPPGKSANSLDALVGQPIEVSGLTLDGRPVSLSRYKGKVVLIDFWATWCGPCMDEIPNIFENYKKYNDVGFDVLAISTDKDMEELKSFVLEERPPWTVLADKHPQNTNSMGSKFGISGIPTFILVGKDGKVLDVGCRGPELGRRLAQVFGK